MVVLCPFCRGESEFTIEDAPAPFTCSICFAENCSRKASLTCNHPDCICETCIMEIANADNSTLPDDNILAIIWGIMTSIDPLHSLAPIQPARPRVTPSQPAQVTQNSSHTRISSGPNGSLMNSFYINYDIRI